MSSAAKAYWNDWAAKLGLIEPRRKKQGQQRPGAGGAKFRDIGPPRKKPASARPSDNSRKVTSRAAPVSPRVPVPPVISPDVRTLRPADLTKAEYEHRELHFGAGAGMPGEKAPDSLLRTVIAKREAEMEAAIVALPATSLVVHCGGCGRRTSAECGYCVECGGKRRARREARLARNAPPTSIEGESRDA